MIRRVLVLAAMLMAVFASGAIAQRAGQTSADDELASPKLRISWPEFKELHDQDEVIVVDVRGADAYAAGHIPGARSIPLEQIEGRAADLQKEDKQIVVYCA